MVPDALAYLGCEVEERLAARVEARFGDNGP